MVSFKRNKPAFILALLLLFALFLNTCERLDIVKIVKIETKPFPDFSYRTAILKGIVHDIGEGQGIQHGHYWATHKNPSSGGSSTSHFLLGTLEKPHEFSDTLNGLLPGTTYYYVAYCYDGKDYYFGEEYEFTSLTLSTPFLTTDAFTFTSIDSAICGGTVTSDGGEPVFARGICYSASQNPTVEDNKKTMDGVGMGSFSSTVKEVMFNSTYYVRAYATNVLGTSYGEQISFTTIPAGIDAVFKKLSKGTALVIDGIEEELWNILPPIYIENSVGWNPTVTAYWKGMWDDSCIYILANVEDEDHYPGWEVDTFATWEWDCVEMYFDVNDIIEDGLGIAENNAGHWQINPGIFESLYGIEWMSPPEGYGHTISYNAISLYGESYIFEFRIPMKGLINKNGVFLTAANLVKKVIGFEIGVIDQDEGRTTTSQHKNWRYGQYTNLDNSGRVIFR